MQGDARAELKGGTRRARGGGLMGAVYAIVVLPGSEVLALAEPIAAAILVHAWSTRRRP